MPDKPGLHYVKIQLPTKCAVCTAFWNLPGFQNKCGEIFADSLPAVSYGIVETTHFEQFLSLLGKRIVAEEVSVDDYRKYSEGI